MSIDTIAVSVPDALPPCQFVPSWRTCFVIVTMSHISSTSAISTVVDDIIVNYDVIRRLHARSTRHV